LVVSLVPQLGIALSITAAFTAPAFAYAGITFPQHSMPVLAQFWTYLLPLRTLLRLQIEQVQLAAPTTSSLPELAILCAFIVLPLPIVISQLRLRCERLSERGQA
jgi:ABC-2 type transport system permease protein